MGEEAEPKPVDCGVGWGAANWVAGVGWHAGGTADVGPDGAGPERRGKALRRPLAADQPRHEALLHPAHQRPEPAAPPLALRRRRRAARPAHGPDPGAAEPARLGPLAVDRERQRPLRQDAADGRLPLQLAPLVRARVARPHHARALAARGRHGLHLPDRGGRLQRGARGRLWQPAGALRADPHERRVLVGAGWRGRAGERRLHLHGAGQPRLCAQLLLRAAQPAAHPSHARDAP